MRTASNSKRKSSSTPVMMVRSTQGFVTVPVEDAEVQEHKGFFRVVCCIEVEYAGGPLKGSEIQTQIWTRAFGKWRMVPQEVLNNQLRGNSDLTKLVDRATASLEEAKRKRFIKFNPDNGDWAKDRVLLD